MSIRQPAVTTVNARLDVNQKEATYATDSPLFIHILDTQYNEQK